MKRYFGEWNSVENIAGSFGTAVIPLNKQILFASYDYENYSGRAFVLYKAKSGILFEVNGSHCSCYGLEGQWKPEETTWSALAMRHFPSYDEESFSGVDELKKLIAKNNQ